MMHMRGSDTIVLCLPLLYDYCYYLLNLSPAAMAIVYNTVTLANIATRKMPNFYWAFLRVGRQGIKCKFRSFIRPYSPISTSFSSFASTTIAIIFIRHKMSNLLFYFIFICAAYKKSSTSMCDCRLCLYTPCRSVAHTHNFNGRRKIHFYFDNSIRTYSVHIYYRMP